MSGKTILPGFIDAHWHGPHASDQIVPDQDWVYYNSLAYGVTTVHDPSADTHEVFASSELQKAGKILGPRIFSTGTILYGAETPFMAEIGSLDDALANLRRLKASGAWSVKSYNQPRREQRQMVIEAARQLGIEVVPEGGSLFMHNMTDDRRRPHDHRAFAADPQHLRRRRPVLARLEDRVDADPGRRLRRAVRRISLVPA